MTFVEEPARLVFGELCRVKGRELEQSVIQIALSDSCAPIIYRHIQESHVGGLMTTANWELVEYEADPNQKHVYKLPAVQPKTWMSTAAVVPNLVKIERLPVDEKKREELLKIAPFIQAEQEDGDDIEFLITVSSVSEVLAFHEFPAYRHESFRMSVRSLVEAVGHRPLAHSAAWASEPTNRLTCASLFNLGVGDVYRRATGYVRI